MLFSYHLGIANQLHATAQHRKRETRLNTEELAASVGTEMILVAHMPQEQPARLFVLTHHTHGGQWQKDSGLFLVDSDRQDLHRPMVRETCESTVKGVIKGDTISFAISLVTAAAVAPTPTDSFEGVLFPMRTLPWILQMAKFEIVDHHLTIVGVLRCEASWMHPHFELVDHAELCICSSETGPIIAFETKLTNSALLDTAACCAATGQTVLSSCGHCHIMVCPSIRSVSDCHVDPCVIVTTSQTMDKKETANRMTLLAHMTKV